MFRGSVPLVMGTRFDMLVHGTDETAARSAWNGICTLLESLDRMLNRFSPASKLSRLNAGKTTALSPELQSLLEICSGYWLRTVGLFDITRKNFSKLKWRVGTLELGGMDLDFGGIAKGLALRQIQDLLAKHGVNCAYADFGGSSILAVGRHPFGPCWRLKVADPYSGKTVATEDLVDCSLSTSGNRPGYASHIINPADGSKCEGRKMVTVKAPDSLDAEVLSTAVMIADGQQEEIIRKNFPLAEIKRYSL